MDITKLSKLEHFKPGKYEIPFDTISGFTYGLYELCDAWAMEEISHLDGNIEVSLLNEEKLGPPIIGTTIKISDVLSWLKTE